MAMSVTQLTFLPEMACDVAASPRAEPRQQTRSSAEVARANRRDRSLRPSQSVPTPHPGERHLLEAAAMVASPILF